MSGPYGTAWNENPVLSVTKRTKPETAQDRIAAAIIIQAVKDYHYSLAPVPPGKRYNAIRAHRKALREDCEEFFNSEWFETLTDLPPGEIITRCMAAKRSRMVERFDRLVAASRKPKRARFPKWQKKEIKAKRARRCLR